MKTLLNTVAGILTALLLAVTVMIYAVQPFGLQALPVTTGSMGKTLTKGSLIYVKKTDPKSLQPGQMVSFLTGPGQVDTQRVVEAIPDQADTLTIRYRTQGDGMTQPEENLLLYRNVVGIPVFVLPFLGGVANFFGGTAGTLVLIAGWLVTIFLFVAANVLCRPKARRKSASPFRRKKGKFER